MDVHRIHCKLIEWENGERVANGKRTTHMKIVTRVKNFLGQAPTRDNAKQTTHHRHMHLSYALFFHSLALLAHVPQHRVTLPSVAFVCAWFVSFFYCWLRYCCCCPQGLTRRRWKISRLQCYSRTLFSVCVQFSCYPSLWCKHSPLRVTRKLCIQRVERVNWSVLKYWSKKTCSLMSSSSSSPSAVKHSDALIPNKLKSFTIKLLFCVLISISASFSLLANRMKRESAHIAMNYEEFIHATHQNYRFLCGIFFSLACADRIQSANNESGREAARQSQRDTERPKEVAKWIRLM